MILGHFSTHQNRRQAGALLAEKLRRFKDSDAIVVAVSRSSAVVAYHVAKELRLPFEVMTCRKIVHPADSRRTIGSVSAQNVIVHSETYDIPHDYIYHQIILNQNALKAQQTFYNSNPEAIDFGEKPVVIVSDVLSSPDSVIATVKSIRSRGPKEIVLAATLATPEVFAELSGKFDEMVVLTVDADTRIEAIYENAFPVTDEDVRALLLKGAERFN